MNGHDAFKYGLAGHLAQEGGAGELAPCVAREVAQASGGRRCWTLCCRIAVALMGGRSDGRRMS